MDCKKMLCRVVALIAATCLNACQSSPRTNADILTFKKNGGFNWFLDSRALLDGDKLIIGSMAGTTRDGSHYGDVQVTTFDLSHKRGSTVTLAAAFASDDHMTPVLLKRGDGRYLAVFQKHDIDGLMRWTLSTQPGDASTWGPIQTVNANAVDNHGMCFSHLIQVPTPSGTRIYNFARSAGYDPNYLFSDDDGVTFHYGGRVMMWDNPDPNFFGRPYIKYAGHGDTIWFATTEDHPNEYNTGIYAGFLRDGVLRPALGDRQWPLATSTETSVKPTDFTRVFEGKPGAIAFVNDLKIAPGGLPVITFSVRQDDGHDLRYWYASFDGKAWKSTEIAHAGSTIYMGEANYAGLATIDGADVSRVYIAANADPVSGVPLKSAADGKRHFEIYEGRAPAAGDQWTWHAMTADSAVDNIRPVVPARGSSPGVVLWLRGTMTTYKDFDLDIVGRINRAE